MTTVGDKYILPAMNEADWQKLVDGMTEADRSRETVVAHCRMHQLIARKPMA